MTARRVGTAVGKARFKIKASGFMHSLDIIEELMNANTMQEVANKRGVSRQRIEELWSRVMPLPYFDVSVMRRLWMATVPFAFGGFSVDILQSSITRPRSSHPLLKQLSETLKEAEAKAAELVESLAKRYDLHENFIMACVGLFPLKTHGSEVRKIQRQEWLNSVTGSYSLLTDNARKSLGVWCDAGSNEEAARILGKSTPRVASDISHLRGMGLRIPSRPRGRSRFDRRSNDASVD